MEGVRCEQAVDRVVSQSYIIRKKPQKQFNCHVYDVYLQQRMMHIYIYVSLRLRVQNAVPAQPCVGKLGISLVLLNFLHCNFRLWFKTP